MPGRKFDDREKSALLGLLAHNLFQVEYEPDPATDWQQVLRESVQQAVTLHAYDAVGGFLSEEQSKLWGSYAFNSLQYNAMVHNHNTYLHKLLTKNGIDYCILKGCSSAYYYPDPFFRAMGDVDFLIRKEDIGKATEILKAEGLVPWDTEHICHIVFRKEKMHFEMHFEPAGMPEGKAGELIRNYLEDIFDRTELIQTETATFRKPSDFHHGLIILMHTYHHMLSEGIGLRHLCDLAVFFDHFSNDEFINVFYEKLSEVGLWKFTKILGMVSHEYLGLPYRAWMGDEDETLCADVIDDIFNGGNFGSKDKERSNQGIVISNRGKDGIGRPALVQMISTMNELACTPFPFLRKVKVLRPFGWIFLGVRQMFRIVTGKRKMVRVKGLFGAAEHRKKIYMQFHLFETEANKEKE